MSATRLFAIWLLSTRCQFAARRGRRAKADIAPQVASPPADFAHTLPAGWKTFLLAAALVAITANAYAPVFQCGYIWDDDSYVTKNPLLPSAGGLSRIWFELGATPQYYPLVFTSFWTEYHLFGLNPAVSHAVNVALHCASVLLVWRVLLMLGLPAPVAWIAALVFGVHPVHVESVAWITERKNVLSGACYLASLLAYLQFDCLSRQIPAAPAYRFRWLFYALAVLLFVAALLSKTVTASLPVVILLLLWYRHGRVSARDVWLMMPFVLLGIAFSLLTVWLERHHVGAVGQDWNLSPVGRVLLAGRAAWFYAGKLIWPTPLVFIYPRWDIDTHAVWQYLYPLAVGGVLVLLWRLQRNIGRGPLTAVLCFLVSLVPALGFVNVYPMRYSYVADHFQYLASLGIIALVVGVAWSMYLRLGSFRPLGVLMCVVGLLALASLTWRQIEDYADIETLWTKTLSKNPDAWIAAHNLGVMHMDRNQRPQAESYFREVVRVRPQDARANTNLGLLQLAKRDLPGAIAHFETAIQGDPDYSGARLNLCQIQIAQGQLPQAAENYLHALGIDPHVAVAQQGMALSLVRAADPQTAGRFVDAALHIKPDWSGLVSELAWKLATSAKPEWRDPAQAQSRAQRAVEMTDGKDAKSLDALAAAQAAAGQFKQAANTARQAIAQARQHGQTPLADEIESRQKLYEQQKAYVAAPSDE